MTALPLSRAAAVAVALAGCASAPRPGPGGAEVRSADSAWADTVAARDDRAFLAAVDEGAVFVGGRALGAGRDGVWRIWRRFFAPGSPAMRWFPTEGEVAASGDLGWTVGRYRVEGPPGKPPAAEGAYLTVWARRPGGPWRAAMDCGLEPAAAAEGMERSPAKTLTSGDGTLEASIGTYSHPGRAGPPAGAWLTVRERGSSGWRVRFDTAISFPE
jgi:ketosteroid isomerase-like protein